MAEEEKKIQFDDFFDKLITKRKKEAEDDENNFSRGNSNEEDKDMYPDKAHFVYELLQNADDAEAEYARFVLNKTGLFFVHNGKPFSISNPATEKEDHINGELGDINAITAFRKSNKSNNPNSEDCENKIGKFGVGFKAVFQYTNEPHIYDRNFKFKIINETIPDKNLGANKNPAITFKQDETVFYFPFIDNSADESYQDIFDKLKNDLVYPTLFLSYLGKVEWNDEYSAESGIYEEKGKNKEEQEQIFEEIKYRLVNFNSDNAQSLCLFSKTIVLEEEKNKKDKSCCISVGFGFDCKNKQLIKLTESKKAFCFFPTDTDTYLNFIIHAPFLLTLNRAGIKDKKWNKDLIDNLAKLAADSLNILKKLELINDSIIEIIPYKETDFYAIIPYPYKKQPKFFAPFYDKVKNKFQTEEILPAKDGGYVKKENAYWARTLNMGIYTNAQLAELFNNDNAKWVFTSFSHKDNDDKSKYISSLVRDDKAIIHDDILSETKITKTFIQNQSQNFDFDWLHNFYQYIEDSNNIEKVKTLPIFLDSEGNAVPAFKDGKLNLYFQAESGYNTMCPALLENEKSKDFFIKFGIKEEPELEDTVNKILRGNNDITKHFSTILRYYKKCRDCLHTKKIGVLVNDLSDKLLDENGKARNATELYYSTDTDKLRIYFGANPEKFLNLNLYRNIIKEEDWDLLNEFLLKKIKIATLPKIIPTELDSEKRVVEGYQQQQTILKTDKIIDGSVDFINQICQEESEIKSKIFWKLLADYKEDIIKIKGETMILKSNKLWRPFLSSAEKLLQNSKWIYTKSKGFVELQEITVKDLDDDCQADTELIKLLGIKDNKAELTEEQQRLIERGKRFENWTEEKIAKFEKWERESEQNTSNTTRSTNHSLSHSDSRNSDDEYKTRERKLKEYIDNDKETAIENRFVQIKQDIEIDTEEEEKEEITDEELNKKVKELIEKEQEENRKRKKLKEELKNNEYSYEWFKSYLGLLLSYRETLRTNDKKQKSLSFQDIKRYTAEGKAYENWFILYDEKNGYIPSSIGESKDFHIILLLKNGRKEPIEGVESVSKRGQNLVIYCPTGKDIEQYDVASVSLSYTPVTDLLSKLDDAFCEDYVGKWQHIEEALPPLHYIYGPPGTGKTTALCERINGFFKSNPKVKILILTPTNKAADVLCKKFFDNEDEKCFNPDINIVRLGNPTDFDLEQDSVYRESLNEFELNSNNIVASTIHRLPYCDIDGKEENNKLFQSHWDYVIFDESSMTGLPYMVFALRALHKFNKNVKFFIAGDPKQIPPVIEVNDKELEDFDFQDENIYKMMKLKDFYSEKQDYKDKQIIRSQDDIEPLKRQYRSVKQIGQLFSELSYSKFLEHDRYEIPTEENKPKSLPEGFKKLISANVTFIDMPLDKDSHPIYKINTLNGSSYQTYCAILVAEIIKRFDSDNKKDNNEKWKIGLISPYKAQATLLNKLVSCYGVSNNITIYADTVHGFQGDECDIVFFICNPNNYKYTGNKKCLLSKEYIYNVAISRAKDYLIIIHPYSDIDNNEYINDIKDSYKNNFALQKIVQSYDIEELLFGNGKYIYANSDSAAHDNVNVFGVTDMKYVVKASDNAIDIQLGEL